MTFKVHQEAQQSTTSLLIEFSFCDKVLDKTLAKKLLFKERKTSKRRENVHQLYADWLTDYSTWVGPQATSKSFGIKVTFLFMERPVQNVMVRCYSTRKSDQNELLSSQIRWKLAIIANQNWVIFANICIQHWLWKGLWKNGDNGLALNVSFVFTTNIEQIPPSKASISEPFVCSSWSSHDFISHDLQFRDTFLWHVIKTFKMRHKMNFLIGWKNAHCSAKLSANTWSSSKTDFRRLLSPSLLSEEQNHFYDP